MAELLYARGTKGGPPKRFSNRATSLFLKAADFRGYFCQIVTFPSVGWPWSRALNRAPSRDIGEVWPTPIVCPSWVFSPSHLGSNFCRQVLCLVGSARGQGRGHHRQRQPMQLGRCPPATKEQEPLQSRGFNEKNVTTIKVVRRPLSLANKRLEAMSRCLMSSIQEEVEKGNVHKSRHPFRTFFKTAPPPPISGKLTTICDKMYAMVLNPKPAAP